MIMIIMSRLVRDASKFTSIYYLIIIIIITIIIISIRLVRDASKFTSIYYLPTTMFTLTSWVSIIIINSLIITPKKLLLEIIIMTINPKYLSKKIPTQVFFCCRQPPTKNK